MSEDRWEQWLVGDCELVIVCDLHGEVALWDPEPSSCQCPDHCVVCPDQIVEHIGRITGKPLEFDMQRQCDSRWHRVRLAPVVCRMLRRKMVLVRIRSLDLDWSRLTARERQLVTVSREHGFEHAHEVLGISAKTAWSHRRSICAKARLLNVGAWHRFIHHNG